MARSGCIYGGPERWLPVPGHGDQFVASSYGRVARVVGHEGANGYQQISMERYMKPFKAALGGSQKWPWQRRGYAHHLVALAFHGYPPKGKNQVNHKDFNRQNNRPENLEWCDQKENLAHFRAAHPDFRSCARPWKYSVTLWKRARKMIESGVTYRETARRLGMTASGVRWAVQSNKYREVA